MKLLRFLFSFFISVGLIILFNQKASIPGAADVPPLGKLLDPFHGFWQNADSDPLEITFMSELPQLQGDVIIQYEENLIPHLYASNEYDLYFAQGYLTAYHRLWQMEFQMYVAAGRVSEILGEVALNFDRLQRRKGLVYGAENSLRELEKRESDIQFIQAYSDGVNAFIEQLEYKDYPVEYKLLDYRPETWTPLKNVLLLKYMADDLAGSDYDLQNTNAVHILGKERFDFLFPDFPEEIDPIIPENVKWNFNPLKVKKPDSFKIVNKFSPIIPKISEEGKGSNSWAISPRKTKNGNAIFCNDPHLSFTLPSIWFAQQLNAPGINTFGVTIPGLPGVLLGFNDSIAWGLTNGPRDVRDWYQITFKNQEKEEYLYDGKWLKAQKRIESIHVKGGDTFIDTVIYTHYGPIVYDNTFLGDTAKVNFALHWTAHNPSKEMLVIYNLNRASTINDIENALKYFECPPQNVTIGTRNGDIGIFIEGKFPLKWEEQGKFLMDGSNSIYEWQGYIPYDHNAKVINPDRGFVSSANQHPFTHEYPYYYYNNTQEYFRNRRINSNLSALTDITVEDMKVLQNDTYHLLAAEVLPIMLDYLDEKILVKEQLELYQALKDWDYFTGPEQIAPSYFEAWWDKLKKLLWDEFDRDQPLVQPNEFTTLKILRDYPDDSSFDILNTPEKENINAVLSKSFLAAVDSIISWKEQKNKENVPWYEFKNTRLMHMTNIEAFSRTQIPTGGNKHIVCANGPRWGASWRLIAEMGDQINAVGIYPGGQSGNPGSPAYETFIDDWASGRYFDINFWENPVEQRGNILTIKLSPGSGN